MKAIAEMSLEEITAFRRTERLRGLSDNEVVHLWYRAADGEEWTLTPQQDAIRQRWDMAKARFLKRDSYAEVAAALVEEFGIGIATARRDIAQAMKCFGDLDKVPKEAHRQRAIEMSLLAFKVAKKQKDAGSMTKATMAYIAATGVDKDDAEGIDIEKIMKDRMYVEVLDPAIRELILNLIQQAGGSIDVSQVFEKIYAAKGADYVAYESISDDAGDHPG